MEWRGQFQPWILSRGLNYYQQGLVTNYQRSTDGIIHAEVLGTQVYQVNIELGNFLVNHADCDCPYAANGKHCKHQAAVLMMAEAVGDLKPSEGRDENDGRSKKIDSKPTSPVERLVSDATDEQVRHFLISLLEVSPSYISLFKLTVLNQFTPSDMVGYQQEIDDIFEDQADDSGFIDYYAASDFEEELSDFINRKLKELIKAGHYSAAFKLTCYLATKLTTVDIDDSDGEITALAFECQNIWETVLDHADLALEKKAFKWFNDHLTDSFWLFQDIIEELLFNRFQESGLLKIKLKFTQQKLTDYQTASKDPDQWTAKMEAEKWAQYHLTVMVQMKSDQKKIQKFCQENIQYPKIRQYYVDLCIENHEYNQAIRLLTEGKKQAKNQIGVVIEESRQLKSLYLRLDRTEDYLHELSLLLTEYDPANLADFHELKSNYSEQKWPQKRDELFKAIPESTSLESLYAVERLYKPLLKAVLAENGLGGVKKYANLLKPKFSDQLLQKYEQELGKMAAEAQNRKRYRGLVKILEEMLVYPGGKGAVREIIKDWRAKYPRRTAMMDELKQLRIS